MNIFGISAGREQNLLGEEQISLIFVYLVDVVLQKDYTLNQKK